MAEETLAPTIQDLYAQDELARLQEDAFSFEEQQDRERLAERRAAAPAGIGASLLPQPRPQTPPQEEATPQEKPQAPVGVGAFGLPQPKPGEAAASGTLGGALSQAGHSVTEQLHLTPENLEAAKGRQGLTVPADSPQGVFLRNTLGALKGAQAGALGFLGMLEANLEQLVGIRTPAGRWALSQAEQLGAQAKALTPDDPLFLDKFVQTAAVQLPLFAVGMGTQGLVQGLSSWAARYGPAIAPWLGASVSGISEAALEAGSAYKSLLEFFPPEEATRRANQIFWHNAALLAITNRLGVFNDRLPLLMKLPVAMVGEAGQELAQSFRIERDGLAVPVDHPQAALLRASGWVEVEQPRRTMHTDVFVDTPDTERVLKFPIQWHDVRDIAAISAILGGMGATVETAVSPQDFGAVRTPPSTPAEAEAFLAPGEFGFVASEAAEARAEAQAPESAVRDPQGGLRRVFPLGEAGQVGRTPPTQAPGETAASQAEAEADAGHPLPKSQVVDEGGNLQRVFHGTTAVFDKHDPAKRGSGGGGDLYGPGEYYTEAPEVASGYSEGGPSLGIGVFQDLAEAEAHAQETGGRVIPVRAGGEVIGYKVEPASAPNVRPAYLDIRNPFAIDAPADPHIVSLMHELDFNYPVQADGSPALETNGDIYEALTAELGNKAEVNDWLDANGFDGITHIGGSGAKAHRVWIAFRPEQVIPAFDLMQQLRERQARGQRGALDLSSNAQPRLPKLPLTVSFQQHDQGVVVRWEHANGNARNRVLPSYQDALQFAADFQADFDVTVADTSPLKPESLPRPRVGFDAFGRTPNPRKGTAPLRPYPTVEELESGQQRLDLLGNERGSVGRAGAPVPILDRFGNPLKPPREPLLPLDHPSHPPLAVLPPESSQLYRAIVARGAGLVAGDARTESQFVDAFPYIQHLPRAQRQQILHGARQLYKEIVREYTSRLSDTTRLLRIWKAGEAHKGWYLDALSEARMLFGADAEVFLGFLAATSPQSNIENNLEQAIGAFVAWKTQRAFSSQHIKPRFLPQAMTGNLERAAVGQPLSGLKVENFRHNLLGDPEYITIDLWMQRIFGVWGESVKTTARGKKTLVQVAPGSKEYRMLQGWTLMLARQHEVSPAEMQAALWAGAKLIQGPSGSETRAQLDQAVQPIGSSMRRKLLDMPGQEGEVGAWVRQHLAGMDDRGVVNLGLAIELARVFLGAGLGAGAAGDDLEEQLMGALLGAGLSRLTSRRVLKGLRGILPNLWRPKTVPETGGSQPLWDQLMNERGAIDLFGQEQAHDIPDPQVPPELAAEAGAQPSPEQLGLSGVPQQTRFQLPPDLAQATPRLGSVPLQFESPMDMALYILGNAQNRSAADARYLQEVMDFTRQSEADVRRQAALRRQAIVEYARPRGEAGKPLRIPDMSQGEAQTAPTLQAQPGEEAQPLLTGLKLEDYRDAQGLPVLKPETVEALRDFMRLQETDQEIEGKPRDVNFRMVSTDEGVKKVLAAVSEVYLDEIDAIRKHMSRDEVRTAALNMGMTLEQFLETDREHLVSRKKAALAQEFLVAGGRQLKVAQALWKNGNLSSRDFLRVFAIQVAIQSQTARLKNEAGGALSQLARPVEGELFSLRGFDAIMEYLGSQNVSAELLDSMLQAAPTPEQLEMKLEQAPDATGAGMLRELFYGLYLASFTPHVANIVSNFGLLGDGYLSRVAAAWSGGKPLSLEEAQLRTIAGKSDLTTEQRTQLLADPAALFERDLVRGEANAYLWGVTHAVIDGLKLAGRSAKAGVSMFEEEILKGHTGENIIEASLGRKLGALTTQNLRGNLQGSRLGRVALSLTVGQQGLTPMGSAFDLMGKLLTLSGKGLLAEDAFFKFLHYQGELHAQAWRKAVLDAHAVDPQTGRFRPRRDVLAEMQRFLEHPPPEVRRLAMQRANELTLTKDFRELGVLGRAIGGGLDQLARGSVVGMLLFPFMRIASNAAEYSLQRLPLVSLLQEQVRADLRAGGARAKMRKGQLAMGHLVFGVAALFAGLGLIRGSGPDDPEAKRLKRATGWEPYTIVIPGTSLTVAYDRFEPFAQSVAIAADLMDAYPEVVNDPLRYQEWLELAAAGGLAFAENIFQKSYAEGMENLTELLFSKEGTPEGRKQKWERFMLRLSRGLVPSGIGRVETALDPRLNEVRTHLDAWRSRLPKASDGLSVQRDYWGDAVELSTTGYGIDIFLPYTVAVDKGLSYGPPSVDNLRSALAAKDTGRLKVWVAQIMLANTIVFHRPSEYLVRNTRDKDPELGDVQDAIRLPPDAVERLRTLFGKEVTDSQGRTLVEALAARILDDDWLRDLNRAGRERALRQVHEAFLGKAEATLRRETEADPTLPWHDEVTRALQVQRVRRTRTRESQKRELNVLEQLQQQLEISR
jgi:hypothetical protein